MLGSPLPVYVVAPSAIPGNLQRQQRGFICAPFLFSLKQLSYLEVVSGRDEPKIERAGLSVRYEGGIPFFDEAGLAVFCRKLFVQTLEESTVLDTGIIERWYPEKDFHYMYICCVEKVLVRA